MKDNYLWDRSGEPDPEIQELEEILGTLRYQPRPLDIPRQLQIGRRRSFFPAMAIAAAIALFAVLLGLWFGFNRRQAPVLQANRNQQVDQPAGKPQPQLKPKSDELAVQTPKPATTPQRNEASRSLIARNQKHTTRTAIRQPELTPDELAEKEQVLVALRLVSAKLNLAQRRTQGLPQLNSIRNQHKIG
jgi:hypothetical protein